MKIITLTVDGIPQPRQSFRYTESGHKYQPNNTRAAAWINLVRMKANLNKPPEPLTGPLKLTLIVRRPLIKRIPKHYLGWPMTKPDSDNYLKPIKDTLQGIFYVNDGQICDERTIKIYHHKPGACITISELERNHGYVYIVDKS